MPKVYWRRDGYIVGEEKLDVADLIEKYLASQERIEDLEDDQKELQEKLGLLTAEGQTRVTRLLGDVFNTGCPVNDPNDPSWDVYLKLLSSARE